MAGNFIEQDPQQQPPTQPQAQPAGDFMVAGDDQDNIRRMQAIDPTEAEQVTEEEQAQYDDFVSRAIAMISDTRTAPPDENGQGAGQSPSDAVLAVMNNASFTVPQALAEGAAHTAMILHNAAKRAGQPYSPDVMFHAADEIIAGLYLLGSAAGVFQGTPDHSWAMKQPSEASETSEGPQPTDAPTASMMAPADLAAQPGAAQPEEGGIADGDFTHDEYMMMGEARMLATEKFGGLLQQTGQLTEKEQAEAQDFWKSQIEKEVEMGNVDDSMFDNMDLPTIRANMMKGTR